MEARSRKCAPLVTRQLFDLQVLHIGKFELLHDHFVIYFVIYNFERKGMMNIEAETLFDRINGASKEIGDILRGELSLIFIASL